MTPPEVKGYEVLRLLGESAVTELWCAYQPSLERFVSLKFMRKELVEDADEVERFVAEARRAASLRHASIVTIYDVGLADGRPYTIMEYVDGCTLYEQLTREGPLPPERAVRIACAVADALGYAWDHAQLIHRNVSPAVIRLDADGSVKVNYIGLSLRVDLKRPSIRLEPGCIEGTPYYMSPEQARGGADIDHRTDMYGLGATLYHMLTGRMPFGEYPPLEAVHRQIHDLLPHPSAIGVNDLPETLLQTLSRLLRKHGAARFETWKDAREALKRSCTRGVVLKKRTSTTAPREPSTLDLAPPPPEPAPARKRIAGGRVGVLPARAPARKRIVVRKRA